MTRAERREQAENKVSAYYMYLARLCAAGPVEIIQDLRDNPEHFLQMCEKHMPAEAKAQIAGNQHLFRRAAYELKDMFDKECPVGWSNERLWEVLADSVDHLLKNSEKPLDN